MAVPDSLLKLLASSFTTDVASWLLHTPVRAALSTWSSPRQRWRRSWGRKSWRRMLPYCPPPGGTVETQV